MNNKKLMNPFLGLFTIINLMSLTRGDDDRYCNSIIDTVVDTYCTSCDKWSSSPFICYKTQIEAGVQEKLADTNCKAEDTMHCAGTTFLRQDQNLTIMEMVRNKTHSCDKEALNVSNNFALCAGVGDYNTFMLVIIVICSTICGTWCIGYCFCKRCRECTSELCESCFGR